MEYADSQIIKWRQKKLIKMETMSQQDFTTKDYISRIISDLEIVVEKNPYLAFSALFVLIELLGKCLNSRGWNDGQSNQEFFDAIQSYPSLQKYQIYNSKKHANYNDLYIIRCGFAHRLLLDAGFVLDGDKNDLSKNIIGCKELYSDIKQAWNEILTGSIESKKNLDKVLISTLGSLTGNTQMIEFSSVID